ncbi:N-acetylmuramoyl-L-alanine amidase [Paenibacillus alkaliterrae]|uniref:N-acetylmuramoyl-L-alanine amidase n=1 Tax=Paenibacillus alkaliterrae TaxID=320909 RepID=UPI001F43850C|nr:N-acetylmuramoyl-L-alanine amidase [Paenibacillus alkaliterrae]MCF2937669.1 N-acetylmuramoyl-L-alanine amidase [Paenibacillus alkaliterrae]
MKRFVSMLLFMSVFFTMFAAVGHAAQIVPKLYLNGQPLTSDVNPQIVNESTIVPVRTISEGLGYPIEWDNATKTVTVYNGQAVIKLKLNDSVAKVNDQQVQMDTPASIVKGTTLVPLRFIGEQFGLDFEWKQAEKEVHIYEKPMEPEVPTSPEVPKESEETTGWITQVSFDGISSLKINYAGSVTTKEPLFLDNPKRIVFDLPNTVYSNELNNLFAKGQVESIVADNPFLQKFRYSLFSNSPSVARLVLEVSEDTGFIMSESVGEIRFDLLPANEVPQEPIEPPPVVVDPPVTEPVAPADDGIFDIVIDAGHGGKDPGAISVLKRTEKEFNLSIALKIQALLNKETNIMAHLTRSDDTFVELVDRVKFAEDLKADLFISVHANRVENFSVTGTETFYNRAASKPFADVIHKHLLAATGLKNRGVKEGPYKVIRETTMPAILLEAGFLSNKTDAKLLYDEKVQDRIASEIVAGIKEYLKLK